MSFFCCYSIYFVLLVKMRITFTFCCLLIFIFHGCSTTNEDGVGSSNKKGDESSLNDVPVGGDSSYRLTKIDAIRQDGTYNLFINLMMERLNTADTFPGDYIESLQFVETAVVGDEDKSYAFMVTARELRMFLETTFRYVRPEWRTDIISSSRLLREIDQKQIPDELIRMLLFYRFVRNAAQSVFVLDSKSSPTGQFEAKLSDTSKRYLEIAKQTFLNESNFKTLMIQVRGKIGHYIGSQDYVRLLEMCERIKLWTADCKKSVFHTYLTLHAAAALIFNTPTKSLEQIWTPFSNAITILFMHPHQYSNPECQADTKIHQIRTKLLTLTSALNLFLDSPEPRILENNDNPKNPLYVWVAGINARISHVMENVPGPNC